MEFGWLWLALGLAWLVNICLFVWSLRLRMEVWANRRVIASLEVSVRHAEQKARPNRTNGVGLPFIMVLILVAVTQLFVLLQQVGE